MTRLEIIHVRTPAGPSAELARHIAESLTAPGGRSDGVRIYRRVGLESDVAVHIQIVDDDAGPQPSTLGLHLAAALKAHALVEHSIWEEL